MRQFPVLNRIGNIPINGVPTAILNTLQYDAVNNRFNWVAGGGGSSKSGIYATPNNVINGFSLGQLSVINGELLNTFSAIVMPYAGTLRKLRIAFGINAYTSTPTLEIRKNGVGTGLQVTIPAGDTSVIEDLVTDVVCAEGDLIDLDFQRQGADFNNSTLTIISLEYEAS